MRRGRTLLAAVASVAMAAGLLAGGSDGALADEAPETIRMGYAVSLSGPYAPGGGHDHRRQLRPMAA